MHVTRISNWAYWGLAVLAVVLTSSSCFAQANVSVTTWHNDNGRTGANNNGIVWAIRTESSPSGGNRNMVLYAFDANTLTELYDSYMCQSRDYNNAGYGEKFTVPTIANGYVFVGTQSNLVIFGNTSVACN
jgi:hypothetical protein